MKNSRVIEVAILLAAFVTFSTRVYATTKEEALKMPLGSWPSKLECVKDANGNYTGMRIEEIGITDSPQTGNVISRPFPDPSCHN